MMSPYSVGIKTHYTLLPIHIPVLVVEFYVNLLKVSVVCQCSGRITCAFPFSFFLLFIHRMIPPSSKNFLVNNLAAGTQYDLCVLAIYDDIITSLTATRVVGCVQFTTESEYMRCHFMQSQFLGGTMIIIIGGIIVASVLVFIIILMIRYKVGLSICHS